MEYFHVLKIRDFGGLATKARRREGFFGLDTKMRGAREGTKIFWWFGHKGTKARSFFWIRHKDAGCTKRRKVFGYLATKARRYEGFLEW